MRYVLAYPNSTLPDQALVIVYTCPEHGVQPAGQAGTNNRPGIQRATRRVVRFADIGLLAQKARENPECAPWFLAALAQERYSLAPAGGRDIVSMVESGSIVYVSGPDGLSIYMPTNTYRELREDARESYGVKLPPPGDIVFRGWHGLRRLMYRGHDYVRVRLPGPVPECD